MPNDPQYVRLANRLSRGMVADVHGSGWSIAGLDVRQFPKERVAARFVRKALGDGRLEVASKAEWEDVHDDPVAAEALEQRPDFRTSASAFQEARLQRAATAGNKKLREAREAEEDDDDYDRRQEEREARLEVQQEAGLDEDDIDEQINRSSGTRQERTAKKVGGKKAAKGKKKAAADEE